MWRREIFNSTVNHIPADRVLVDLGGNPLSSMDGKSMDIGLKMQRSIEENEPV